MSDFDMFFYKLESQQRFYLSSATFFKKNSQNSLKKAIEDIRMYLDKYPFRVGDYQITLAMRQPFNENGRILYFTEFFVSCMNFRQHIFLLVLKSR